MAKNTTTKKLRKILFFAPPQPGSKKVKTPKKKLNIHEQRYDMIHFPFFHFCSMGIKPHFEIIEIKNVEDVYRASTGENGRARAA